jgi:DNA-binding CsgD family transcriptional regulator
VDDAVGNEGSGGGGYPRLTRRQAQILELASAGLSDKEIAQRLKISHRTIRTHFEKLFRESGVRNRGQAIAVWSGRPRQVQRLRPADECPYPKPFPPDFVECPAYQATQMVTLDISHRPLGAVWTCRHLEARLMPKTDFRWYGACVIGDAAARRKWSDAVGLNRLHEISQLRQDVSALSGPYVQRLMELKGDRDAIAAELPANETTARRRMVTHQIDGTIDEFMTDMGRLLADRKKVLDHLHLPLRACLQLVRLAIERFLEQGLAAPEWEVPDEVLELFPEDIRSYFRPRQVVAPASPMAQERSGETA